MSNLVTIAMTTMACAATFGAARHIAREKVRIMRAREIDASLRPYAGMGETALAIGIMVIAVLSFQEPGKGIEGNILMVVLAAVLTSSMTHGAFKPLIDGREEDDTDEEEEDTRPLKDGQVRGPAKLVSATSVESDASGGRHTLKLTVLVNDERTVFLEGGVAQDFLRIAALNGAYADPDDVTFTFTVENDRGIAFET